MRIDARNVMSRLHAAAGAQFATPMTALQSEPHWLLLAEQRQIPAGSPVDMPREPTRRWRVKCLAGKLIRGV